MAFPPFYRPEQNDDKRIEGHPGWLALAPRSNVFHAKRRTAKTPTSLEEFTNELEAEG